MSSGAISPEEAVALLPSATVVLVRDGVQGLEVLLVQRNQAVKHMGGMWVFPGGKVDPVDEVPEGDAYLAAVNAAIRETREEAGVDVDADQLVYLSHWIAPKGADRRFATWFFLTLLENDQEVQVDGGEISNHRWVTPRQALEESGDETQPLRLVPPTYVTLWDIADCASCAEARQRMAAREPMLYAPRVVLREDTVCFLYGGDAGYDDENSEASGPQHRLYMRGDQLTYVRDQ